MQISPQSLTKIFRQLQSQSRAWIFTVLDNFRAMILNKNFLLFAFIDTNTSVDHIQIILSRGWIAGEGHTDATDIGKFDGVRNKIVDNLFETNGVCDECFIVWQSAAKMEIDFFTRGPLGKSTLNFLHQAIDIDLAPLKF